MLANFPIAATIPTVDLARARRFYGQTLGLPEMPLPAPAGAGDLSDVAAMFRCGAGTMLLVYARETPTTADNTAAGWIVADFDAVADGLLARGLTFERYDDMPGITWDERGVAFSPGGSKGAWFKDPDGNILSLTEVPGS